MVRITRRTFAALVLLCSTAFALANGSLTAHDEPAQKESVIIAREVVVQEGDSLRSIARRELGKASFVSLLADYNNLTDNASLTPGSFIRIPIHVPAREEFAEVVFVKGTVTAQRQSFSPPQANLVSARPANPQSSASNTTASGVATEIIKLERNAYIFPGDVITTSRNGYLSVAFSGGSVINLQPDTVASLDLLFCLETDQDCQIEISTQRGRVTSNIEARDQQPIQFRVTTPYASAAVRGTVFDISAQDKLNIGVLEGAVDVSAQNETVGVPMGFGLSVEAGEPPGQPVELIPAPVFKRVPARFAVGDTLEWWPFNDASTYQAVLSSDEAAAQVLTDFTVPGNNTAILDLAATLEDNIEPGDYFITIRAVSQQGLEGFPSNSRITLASIDTTISPVSTSVTRDGSEFLVSVEDGPDDAQGYEIQISSDETFSDPLSVDVNNNGRAVFRIDEDQVFSRARVLVDPYTVSAFGEPSSN